MKLGCLWTTNSMAHHQETNIKLPYLLVLMRPALCYPTMTVFKGKRLNREWTKGEIPNTLYGMSPQGWINHELFAEWLEKLFIKNIPQTRPV